MNSSEKWRVWIYYRLSRDEDAEMNSLKNQKRIIMDYVERSNHIFVGESFDDNISGMTFKREGIEKVYEAAANKIIDAVLVKDLSRLGRHKLETAMFIEDLRQFGVRVFSVIDNMDSFNDEDEMRMDFTQLMNHYYARDVRAKVISGYRQKQKDNGVCNMPPMGYYKDKNTNQIIIMDEPANIVKQIYEWYLEGYGLRNIASRLNDAGIKSPAYYQKLYNNKNQGNNKPAITFKFLWESTAVKRVLQNEFYTGTLICHVEETNKVRKIRKKIPIEEQFRHENYAPPIISKDVWDKVQILLNTKTKSNVRASSGQPFHRYTGLLRCGECECTFVAKKRKNKDDVDRVEYVCNGYHRYKDYCTSHRIREEDLDKLVYGELKRLRNEAEKNWSTLESQVKKWIANKHDYENEVKQTKDTIFKLNEDIKKILMEKINDKENSGLYEEMIAERKNEIEICEEKISKLQNIDETIKKRRKELKVGIEILDNIITEESVSNANLRLLIKQIIIFEENKKLSIVFEMNAPFSGYGKMFDENGNLLMEHDGEYHRLTA